MTALAKMTLLVDMPDNVSPWDAESWVAHAVAEYFASLGYPGNASVTLVSLDYNASVTNATPPAAAPIANS